ncbi:DUF5820 family protein [Halobaculum litoreum]|uniref:DUF5820 family protein n=1 Tax=Halobaculum litoreum TaxID=3031998 RepID=A0ABD5XTY5_9EURY|nr:DUF5820 family protein [Halobaculum sp. DT92]
MTDEHGETGDDAAAEPDGWADGADVSVDPSALGDGWRVWNEEPGGRAIVVYRPDVFDADRFPAPCLPTVYLTNGSRRARPGSGQYRTDEWHVTLFLEPEVEAESRTFDERAAAVDGVADVTSRFAAGAIDYRGAYQVPREAYLDELDALVRGD